MEYMYVLYRAYIEAYKNFWLKQTLLLLGDTYTYKFAI